MFISVWCEYDINGDFGGNNNQDVFSVSKELTQSQVEDLVLERLKVQTGLDEEELEGLYGWEYLAIKELS